MAQDKLLFPDCDDEDVIVIDGDLFKVNRIRTAIKSLCDNSFIQPIFKSLATQKINVGEWGAGAQSFHRWIDINGQGCKLLSLGNPSWINIKLRFSAIASFYTQNVGSNYIAKVNLGNADDVLHFVDNFLYKLITVSQALEVKLNEPIVPNTFANSLTQTLSLPKEEISTISQWFTTGKDCEYLKVGASSWQKGVIKLGFYVGVVNQNGEFENMDLVSEIISQQPESSSDIFASYR